MPIDRARLANLPEPAFPHDPGFDRLVTDSVHYLASDAALASLGHDSYWPKWHSPWWHMLALFECGEAQRIPRRAVDAMVAALAALRLHTFPIHPEDSPEGTDPHRDSSCHCALGSIVQVLVACGVDVDQALPWAAPWFIRYQMADGGLTCDNTAYLVPHECPSSMVGTIAPFEAMLALPHATPDRRAFLDRAAAFLVARELRLGSSTAHNAEERTAAPTWFAPCFPRFYFYDVVRGLAALVRYAQLTGTVLPERAVRPVVDHLVAAFPDGVIRLQRQAFAEKSTMAREDDGTWVRGRPASSFPLLAGLSAIGSGSPFVTRQWSRARRGLLELLDAGKLV